MEEYSNVKESVAATQKLHFMDKSLEVTDQILKLMANRGWKSSDLARVMKIKKSEVETMLSGNHNFSLREIAHIETILNENVIFTVSDIKIH